VDALRVFIMGAKKSLSDILFAKSPKALTTVLAFAQEEVSNRKRYQFVLNYSKSFKNRGWKPAQRHSDRDKNSITPLQNKTRYFSTQAKCRRVCSEVKRISR